MSNDVFTFATALSLAPEDPALTELVISKLENIWGELPATEIAAMSKITMLATLSANLTTKDGYNNGQRLAIADAIIKLLKALDITSTAPTQPTTVPIVKLTIDKTPEQMSARELLAALVAQPDAYDELKLAIGSNQQIQAASNKAGGLWVITNDDGRIDLEQTVEYIAHLNQRFSRVLKQFNGRRPTNLAKALGHDERALIHPFTGKPVQGPDDNGFDLSELDPELHEALLWANITGHPAWPSPIDLYSCTAQVLKTPLDDRWQRILDDYLFAKEEKDASVRLITRFWPVNLSLKAAADLGDMLLGSPSGRHNALGSTEDQRYQRLLKSMAQTRYRHNGIGNTIRGGVYDTVTIGGTNTSIKGVIVLEGGSVSGINVDGKIYAPTGVTVEVSGINTSVQVINLSWEALARKAGLIG